MRPHSHRARTVARDGLRASATAPPRKTVRRNAVNQLRHTCTNYDELVADVTALYGHGRRDDVITLVRNRSLRALAHRFPPLADACQAVALEGESPPYRQPTSTAADQDRKHAAAE